MGAIFWYGTHKSFCGISGFQTDKEVGQDRLRSAVVCPETPPELMSYVYYIDTEAYQLSWTSRLGNHYAIESSTDLNNWQLFVSDIPSQGHTTEVTGILDEFSERIFLRVMEVEAEGGIDPNNTLSSQKR